MIPKNHQTMKSNLCIECKKRIIHSSKLCRSCYDKWLKKVNPEYKNNQKENTKQWIKNNVDKYKKGQKDWLAKQDKEYIKVQRRNFQLQKYGLNIESYNKLLEKQNGMCAICGKKETKKSLAVDHCHQTGKVRGLLCFRCNFGLSYFSENAERFLMAYNYLK